MKAERKDPFDRLDEIIAELRKLNREAARIIDRHLDYLAKSPAEGVPY